jgi:hypothetical protein
MHEEQMTVNRMKLIGVALLATFALGAVTATTAQAEEAPYWSIEGTRLAAGKTAEVTAKAVSDKTVTAGGVTVTCTGGKLKAGAVMIGSNAGEPGKAEGVIELTGCTVSGNGEGCEVPGGDITTEPLTGELAYAKNKKSLVGVTTPKKGKTFVSMRFEGSGCTTQEAILKGSIVGGIFTDSSGRAGELLELGESVAQATSFIGKASGTARSEVWLITGGSGKAVEVELTAFGTEAALAGEDLASLVSGKLWSPLL